MYRKLAAEIEDAIDREGMTIEETIELAVEYATACEAVNARLQEIVALLNQGLITEAIELAEQPPRVLDLYNQLDLPNLDRWLDRLLVDDIELPPRLLTDAAEQLEDAYDDLRRLGPLLERHRIAALANAPLRFRIELLYRLKESDPTNPIWPVDIEALEMARVEQMRQEFLEAKENADIPAMKQLAREASGNWSIALPNELRTAILRTLKKGSSLLARKEMKPIAAELNEALIAFDADRGRKLRERWMELAQRADLTDDDPLAQSVREALVWLEEEDARQRETANFENALRQIEIALDEKCSLADLERRIYEAEKYEREWPPSLVHRIQLYRQNRLSAIRARRAAIVAATIVALIAISTTLYLVVSRARFQNQIRTATARIAELADDYVAAEAYYQSLPASVQTAPEVAVAWGRTRQSHEEAERKDQAFRQLVDNIQLDGPLGPSIDSQIKSAAELADDPDETTEIELLKRKVAAMRQERQATRNQDFLTRLEEVAKQVDELETKLDDMPLDTLNQSISKTVEQVQQLVLSNQGREDGLPKVGLPLLQQADILKQRLQKLARTASQNAAARKALDRLVHQPRTAGEYKTELMSFVQQFPTHSLAPKLTEFVNEAPYWDTWEQWKLLATRTEWGNLAQLTQEQARELLEEIAKLETSAAPIELDASIADTKEILTKLATTDSISLSELKEEILNLCRLGDYRSQRVLIQGNTLRYYSEERETSTGIGFKVYQDRRDHTAVDSIKLDNDEIDYHGLAPHTFIAEAISDLTHESTDDVHHFILAMLKTSLSDPTDYPPVDPIPRAFLIDQILRFSIKAESIMRDKLQEMRDSLEIASFESINWYDPENTLVTKTRQKLENTVFPRLKSKLRELESLISQLEGRDSPMLAWRRFAIGDYVGWAANTTDDRWELKSGSHSLKPGDLYVITPAEGSKPARLERVGTIDDSGAVQFERLQYLKTGRPVFCIWN